MADKDRLGNPLQTLACHACGLVSINPRPSDEDLDHFYREEYRKSYKQAVRPKVKHVYRAGRVALDRLNYLLPLLHQCRTIMDLGAGGGELLFMLRGLGFDVQGIEPNLGYGDVARDVLGLPVQVTTYKEANVEAESVDMVTCFHVLEHLPHPVDALASMASWLKNGGLMLIEVPHVMSRCQWPQSRHHIGHLHHFSSSTLTLAGQKAGLRAVDVFTSGDGGNLMAVFRKAHGSPAVELSSTVPGHAQRVIKHLRTHTDLVHLLSPYPYLRPLEKVVSRLMEQIALREHRDVHAILSHLLEEARRLAKLERDGNPMSTESLLPHSSPTGA